jgi:enoyl-CoA hydratase/carnithine racemase
MGEFVSVEISAAPGVGVIRLNRPPMNALNAQMQDELVLAATQLADDDAVRAVVVFGGDRLFAAGADVKELARMDRAAMARSRAYRNR